MLENPLIFFKLWEADVMQSHDASHLKVNQLYLDCSLGGEFVEKRSLWQAGELDETTGSS